MWKYFESPPNNLIVFACIEKSKRAHDAKEDKEIETRRKSINDEKKTQHWMPMRETDDDENATFGFENSLVSYRKNRMFLRDA